ncbi:hypothetical protein ACL6C3_08190 [Capilliphycus salinus ALCB114379]|uniref:hypothetical protein n=1 Tax=Capilliphycus salinus TaxID=2768948 RepID=UPI0039A5A032
MKPEQITASFIQVLNNQPELFTPEVKQDLTLLDTAVDRLEYIPEAEQSDFLASAIVDFCDVNPPVYQAVREHLNTSQTEDSQTLTEEQRLFLLKKIRSLLS